MRPTAIVPTLCCIAALVLSFLCLFAGSKKGFMNDYQILTLNTSRLGTNLLNPDAPGPLNDIYNALPADTSNAINAAANSLASRLGIEDFYNLHILTYCHGTYTPSVLPNATLPRSAIHKHINDCSNMTALFHFQPAAIIEQALNDSGVDVTLDDLRWPDDIQTGLDALHALQSATFILYCIAAGLIFVSVLLSLLALFTSGRLSACLNVLIASVAFLAIGIASALVTAVMVKATDVINENGRGIGLEAQRGNKYLAITWAATGAMLLAVVWWLGETCVGRRGGKGNVYGKHG
ncbi:integral membrane protein-like protein [Westerdykella ornata]|uniref:Integral membrane protein-like protein n=1 Tax=Westerdykella ornata TaxID=318751 RepID=A0A6A6JZA8_WESOR|nr:integral membrane protein-like protein [Westerdykella ornata]KAF2281178.1 integral membrane protein-like protein [Westerdykella ornata]